MSIIEQAARRLEELSRAGIDVSGFGNHKKSEAERVGSALADELATIDAVTRGRGSQQESTRDALADSPDAANDAPTRTAPLAELDLARLAAAGFCVPDAPRAQLADEYRVIKRPLLQHARGKAAAPVANANRIMVTSSVPGEGKTFTAINLALSIASEIDTTVLLVDADVVRPSVFDRLGLPVSKGLMDVLMNPSLRLSDVIQRTNIERLSLLPAGTSHAHSTELLASESMHRLVDDLAERYANRIIVFDAPPLLPSPESRVLATHMGQILMVVEADRTLQSTLTEALSTIEACPVVMTVLNKLRPGTGNGSYYEYSGNA